MAVTTVIKIGLLEVSYYMQKNHEYKIVQKTIVYKTPPS